MLEKRNKTVYKNDTYAGAAFTHVETHALKSDFGLRMDRQACSSDKMTVQNDFTTIVCKGYNIHITNSIYVINFTYVQSNFAQHLITIALNSITLITIDYN